MPSIFQTREWAEFKQQTGYEKFYEIGGVFVLQKKLPFGRTMLYSPMVGEQQLAGIMDYGLRITEEFLDQIKKLAEGNKSIFYRLELDVPIRNPIFEIRNPFHKAFEEMQPEHTLIIDISKSEEEILAQMKQKGRYNIKIAEKNNVEIVKTTSVKGFYNLYKTMANRQKITFRAESYFQTLIDILCKSGYVEVSEAHIGQQSAVSSQQPDTANRKPQTADTLLAAAIISYYGKRVTYLFGGSSNEDRNVMAPYLLHWEIIKEAKKRGCTEYDMFGIAPNDDKNHPWSGVTRFKKQFGGEEVALLGSYDLIFKPLEYKTFKLAEKIRRQQH